MIRPRGRATCGINAISLFDNHVNPKRDQWHERLLCRLGDVQMSSFSIRHSVQVNLRCSVYYMTFNTISVCRKRSLTGPSSRSPPKWLAEKLRMKLQDLAEAISLEQYATSVLVGRLRYFPTPADTQLYP